MGGAALSLAPAIKRGNNNDGEGDRGEWVMPASTSMAVDSDAVGSDAPSSRNMAGPPDGDAGATAVDVALFSGKELCTIPAYTCILGQSHVVTVIFDVKSRDMGVVAG